MFHVNTLILEVQSELSTLSGVLGKTPVRASCFLLFLQKVISVKVSISITQNTQCVNVCVTSGLGTCTCLHLNAVP